MAIRAALAGASVVAVDLTPEHFVSGQRGAAETGVAVEWIEGDAEALPVDDAVFDVVTSCFGAMFAPRHQRVADELMRVCRPGGTIGLMAFTPEGMGGEFFRLLAPYMPAPPPGASPPLLWGDEAHVRYLFGDRVESLTMTRRTYVERAASPQDYCALFKGTFGPLVAVRADLRRTPERLAEFDRRFLEAVVRWNAGAVGPLAIPYEYLLVIARSVQG